MNGAVPAQAQRGGVQPSPDRGPGEGEGPFDRLIIRGAIVIDGTLANCCSGRGVDLDVLRQAGLGTGDG